MFVQANNKENTKALYYWAFVGGIYQWLTNYKENDSDALKTHCICVE